MIFLLLSLASKILILKSLFPRFMRTQPAIALLSIIFYYSCRIPRNDHIIGERATHNTSSTNHNILSQCRTF